MSVATTRAREHRTTDTVAAVLPKADRGQRARVVLAVLLSCGGLLYYSSHRVGLETAGGDSLNNARAATVANGATLRLGTFNIHGGKGTDDRRDLDRTAADLQDLHLVGLNEIEGPFLWETRDQADELGEKLAAPWLFAPGERRWWHYDYGNGIVSRVPVTMWQRIPLPRAGSKGIRNLLLVQATFNGKPLRVLITHIDRSNEQARRLQMRFVADMFLTLAEPAVLMGDMNSDAQDPEVRRLLDTKGVIDPLAAVHGDRAGRHIDWIFLRGLEVRDSGIKPAGASDHPCVWTEVAMPHGKSSDWPRLQTSATE